MIFFKKKLVFKILGFLLPSGVIENFGNFNLKESDSSKLQMIFRLKMSLV